MSNDQAFWDEITGYFTTQLLGSSLFDPEQV